ncbi:MAG: glycosyltransferase family 4 protein [Rhodocyclaceae bacterium]|nr:glycosyltransferase family 4 protein [Rhodocyclaceae bacterium]
MRRAEHLHTPRVAVVHEWLTTAAGGERVLEQILRIWPEADLFAVVDFLPDKDRPMLQGKRAQTTFIQRLPWAAKRYRNYLPLMPIAIEQLDMSAYDIVISSSHAVAKGVITGPDQVHVSYVHSPIRYAWDLQHQYLAEAGMARGLKSGLARLILHYMRMWDLRSANGVDVFVANSAFIARRIRKVYRRDAQVVHPPVNVARFGLRADKEDFYLTASRMVPYKKMPLIVEAFSRMPERRLVVIGDGPEFERARAVAGPNVELLGYRGDAELVDRMQRARAFVFAAEEDFGITPVEAQACGTPVIAFGKGGSCETVVGDGPSRTGVFFHEQAVEALVDAVARFEALPEPIPAERCRAHAEGFSESRFRDAFRQLVFEAWAGAEWRSVPMESSPSQVNSKESKV